MYNKLAGLGPRFIRALIVILLSGMFTTAHADDAVSQINSFLDQEQIRQGEILSQDQRNTILNVALKYSKISSGAPVSETTLMRAIADALFFSQNLPLGTASDLTANYLRNSLLQQNGRSTIGLGLVSIPYLEIPSYCSGDVLGNDGRQCAFVLHSDKVGAVAETQDATSGAMTPIYSPTTMPIFSKSGSKLNGCYPLAAGIPQASACYNVEYGYSYVYRVKCGGGIFHFNCDLWAEANGAANIQYLATGSDTVGAVISAGINCGYSCIWGTLTRLIKGDDVVSYLLSQDARFFDVRVGPNRNGDSPYVKHGIIAGCAIPQPYPTRLPYLYADTVQDGVTYYDTKIKLGTYHQVPAATNLSDNFSTPVDGYIEHGVLPLHTNMYPNPTTGVGVSPLANGIGNNLLQRWQYTFTSIKAWDFDVMFSGTDAIYTAGVCPAQTIDRSALISGMSGTISGTQFWAYHGSDYSYNSRGLRAVNAIYAFNGEHLPITQ